MAFHFCPILWCISKITYLARISPGSLSLCTSWTLDRSGARWMRVHQLLEGLEWKLSWTWMILCLFVIVFSVYNRWFRDAWNFDGSRYFVRYAPNGPMAFNTETGFIFGWCGAPTVFWRSPTTVVNWSTSSLNWATRSQTDIWWLFTYGLAWGELRYVCNLGMMTWHGHDFVCGHLLLRTCWIQTRSKLAKVKVLQTVSKALFCCTYSVIMSGPSYSMFILMPRLL